MKDLGNEMSPGNAIENGVVRLIATRLRYPKSARNDVSREIIGMVVKIRSVNVGIVGAG